MYILWPFFDLVDVVCLRGHWTLKINLLGLVQGGGVPAVLGGVSVVATYIQSQIHNQVMATTPTSPWASLVVHVIELTGTSKIIAIRNRDLISKLNWKGTVVAVLSGLKWWENP